MPSSVLLASRARALGRQLLVAASALLLVTCTDNPTGPTVGSTLRLAVSPRFKAGTFLSPALPVDQVRLVVYHQPACDCVADSIAGATVPFALTDTAVSLNVPVKLTQPAESLTVQFYLMGGGVQLFFGSQAVVLTSGSAPVIPPVLLTYVGPGAGLDSLLITPRDSILTFGDSLTFGVAAFQVGAPVSAFYVDWRSSLATAAILPDGKIHAPGARSKTTITVQAPNGKADSTTLTFVPKPVTLFKVSGDAQTATKLDTLPLPLRVRVKAADSLGVGGVRVVFHPLGFAGNTVPDTVYTDSLGFAQVRAVLSDSVGTQQWQATATGLAAVTFSATSQVLVGPPYRLKVVTEPTDTTASGTLIATQPVVQVEDTAGLPVQKSGITITAQTYSYLSTSGASHNAVVYGQLSDTTTAAGKVTFTGMRLAGLGADKIVFNASTLLADTSTAIHVKAGAPKTIAKASIDSQTVFADSLVPVPPAVLVKDSVGNVVPNAAAVFQVTAGGGTIPKPVDTVFTDTTGKAALASWKLGAIPGTNSVSATVAGAGSVTFTATGKPQVPTLLMQLQGTSVVGVGRTATLQVKLSSPATATDTLYVTSDSTQYITVSGSPIVLLAGDSLASVTLNGIAAGNDTIRATATGYVAGAIGVPATVNLISLPTTLTVPFGGTTSIGVTLAAPAPAGGVVVTLVSSDTTKVQVLTPTVSFAQGVQSQNGQLAGVALGTASVTASNPNYAPATSSVTTAANLNIVNAAATIYPAFPDTQTVQFMSSGTPIAAPAGGITVALTSADGKCAAVPASVTITGGLSTAPFPVSYGGSTPTPCTSWVVATASGVGPDSILMTVGNPPTIASGTFDVGAGLQGQVQVSLQTAVQGTSNMTIRPLKVGVARFAPNLTTLGVDTLVVPLTNGTTYLYATVAGVDTVTNDSTFVEISIPGYAVDTALVRVRTPAVILYGVPTSTTSLSTPSAIYAYIGVPYVGNSSIQNYQGLRVGHAPVTATFHVTPASVAELTDSTGVLDTVRTAPVPVAANVYYTATSISSGGVGYHPVGAGTSTTTVSIPGFVFVPSTTSTVVSAPTLSAGAPQVGSGLQTSVYVSFGAPVPANDTLTVRSLKPTVLLVSDSVNHVGADSAKVPLVAGTSSSYFYVAGMDTVLSDSSQFVLSIPSFKPDTVWGYVRKAGIVLLGLPTSTTTFTAPSQFYAGIGLPYVGNTAIYNYQPIRAGGSPVTVTFHTAQPAVGKLTDSTLVQDTVRTVVIPVNPASGIYYTPTNVATGGVAYQPIGPGTSTTWATAPGYVQLPSDTVLTTVSAPAIGLSTISVGSGLQTQASLSLGAPTPGVDTLVLKSQNPAVIKLSPNDSTPGTDSIVVVLPANTSTIYFYAQGMEGVVSDSAAIAATIPGYTSSLVEWYVRQAGVVLNGVINSTTTLADSNEVYAEVGLPYAGNNGIYQYQPLRAGSPGATFTIKAGSPTVQTLLTKTGSADSVVLTIPARSYYTPLSVATGGAALKALTTGTDTVQVTGAGFAPQPAATQIVTVAAPGITVNALTVGAGLSINSYSILGASQHGGDTVKIWTSNPAVALVAPDNVTPGTDTIRIFVPNGQTYVNYYVIGVDSAVGTPIIYSAANGFNQGSATATVVQPIVDLISVYTTQTAGAADDAFYAAVGIPYSGSPQSLWQYQQRAAGKPAYNVTFTSSNAAVGTLVTTSLVAATVNAAIGPGVYYTPTSVAGGGAAFRPLTAGTTTVSASIPGFTQTTNAAGETVTVQ